jgi:RNA polymerase sigma factor (sigma-70 family)
MKSSLELDEEIKMIVNAYGASILRFAYSYVKNHSDAEDIAQDVLVSYIKKAPVFEDEARKKAWLMRVTGNKCKDLLRSSWRKRIVALPDDLSYLPGESSCLIAHVLELDEKYRIPIHLFYYEGYTIAQIAGILDCKEATVGTWLDRGRKLIKTKMGDDFFE